MIEDTGKTEFKFIDGQWIKSPSPQLLYPELFEELSKLQLIIEREVGTKRVYILDKSTGCPVKVFESEKVAIVWLRMRTNFDRLKNYVLRGDQLIKMMS